MRLAPSSHADAYMRIAASQDKCACVCHLCVYIARLTLDCNQSFLYVFIHHLIFLSLTSPVTIVCLFWFCWLSDIDDDRKSYACARILYGEWLDVELNSFHGFFFLHWFQVFERVCECVCVMSSLKIILIAGFASPTTTTNERRRSDRLSSPHWLWQIHLCCNGAFSAMAIRIPWR